MATFLFHSNSGRYLNSSWQSVCTVCASSRQAGDIHDEAVLLWSCGWEACLYKQVCLNSYLYVLFIYFTSNMQKVSWNKKAM